MADQEANDTVVIDDTSERRSRWRGRLVSVLLLALVLLVVLVALVVAAFRGLSALNPFDGFGEERVDRSGPAVVKAISDLGELHAASGYYELVIDLERDVRPLPSFLAGERVLFIAVGTVDATVDLSGLDARTVQVDAERTSATIALPQPRLSPPRLDVERSRIYEREQGLVERLRGSELESEVYRVAQRRLGEAAQATGELRTRAEANTRSTLVGLLRSLGFTEVTVTFAG